MTGKLRVLIVDDAAIYRKVVAGVLAEFSDVEVVATAPNGRIALQKIEQYAPDLLLLDIEMPEMDGLQLLSRLRAAGSEVGAIILSGLTGRGAETTLACLELGAFDFVFKPVGGTLEENAAVLRRELRSRLAAYARQREMRAILSGMAAIAGPRTPPPEPGEEAGPAEVVAVGVSTGGPKALAEMLPRLPADLPVPVLIVQHMPPVFTASLAQDLDHRCKLRVREARDGQEICAGEIVIAPGGRQMKVERDGGSVVVRITDDPPENSCRPSVDYLFRSVANVYGGRAIAVIMTGMGNDGAAGCRLLKARGAPVVAQDQATCVVYGMPRQPIEDGTANVAAPLNRLAAEIARLAGRGRCACR